MNNKINFTNKDIIHIVGGNMEYIQFKRLLEYKDIITHAYSLRHPIISFGPNFSIDKYNSYYKLFCKDVGLNHNNIVRPNQDHTGNVKAMSRKESNFLEYSPDYLSKTDGLITNQKNIILSSTNADCILFLIYDPINKVIANIHSGWKGTLESIVISAIKKMQTIYNSNTNDIICCICPSIRKCHFEVGEDVKNLFYNKFKMLSNINDIIEKRNDKYYIDTVLLNKTLLLNIGLKEENIIDSNICSVCNSNQINSFRVYKDNFRLSTAIICLNQNT